MSLLAQRYGKAIFAVARQQDALDAVGADLDRLAAALADPAAAAVVASPETRREARARVVERLLGDAHPLTTNLVRVVLRRRREAVLGDLAAAFRDLVRASRGELHGTAETAKPIDELGVRRLEAHASELAGKSVTLEVERNEELIGGVRLRLGNTLYDGSVATLLEDLERSLMEAPL